VLFFRTVKKAGTLLAVRSFGADKGEPAMEDVGRWIAGRSVAALAGFLAVACASASAQTTMDFYRGKAINLVVSTSVGGGYDLLGRAVGRFLGKHVPGNPRIVVRNMAGPAASSRRTSSITWPRRMAPPSGSFRTVRLSSHCWA
jgi:hypothetical protein